MKIKLLTMTLSVVMLFLVGGCKTTVETGAGAGDVVYANGWLKFKEYTTFEKGWEAALAATKDLKIAIMSKKKDEVLGSIVGRAIGDKKVTIDVNKVSGTVVEFEIKYGSTGDQVQSKDIRDVIRKHL